MFHRFALAVLTLFMLFSSVVCHEFPSCGLPCLGQASMGSCSATDNACLCQNASYCNATNLCFHDSCSLADWRAAYDYSIEMCNAAGVYQNNIINPPPPKRDFVPVYYGRAASA